MKDINNIVVFIKDEAMLEEARRILVENGETFSSHPFFSTLVDNKCYNYLTMDEANWHIGCKSELHTEITLTELETLLKGR